MGTIYTNPGKWIEEKHWRETGGYGPPPRPFAEPAPPPPEFWSRVAKNVQPRSDAPVPRDGAAESVFKAFWNAVAAIYGLLMLLGLVLNAFGLLH